MCFEDRPIDRAPAAEAAALPLPAVQRRSRYCRRRSDDGCYVTTHPPPLLERSSSSVFEDDLSLSHRSVASSSSSSSSSVASRRRESLGSRNIGIKDTIHEPKYAGEAGCVNRLDARSYPRISDAPVSVTVATGGSGCAVRRVSESGGASMKRRGSFGSVGSSVGVRRVSFGKGEGGGGVGTKRRGSSGSVGGSSSVGSSGPPVLVRGGGGMGHARRRASMCGPQPDASAHAAAAASIPGADHETTVAVFAALKCLDLDALEDENDFVESFALTMKRRASDSMLPSHCGSYRSQHKSCLKEDGYEGVLRRSGKHSRAGTKRVSFSTIQMRTYENILGVNPGLSTDGPPVDLGWRYDPDLTITLSVDEYERSAQRARSRHELEFLVTRRAREELLAEIGYTKAMIDGATRAARKVRAQRRQSYNSISVKMGLSALAERASRKLRRAWKPSSTGDLVAAEWSAATVAASGSSSVSGGSSRKKAIAKLPSKKRLGLPLQRRNNASTGGLNTECLPAAAASASAAHCASAVASYSSSLHPKYHRRRSDVATVGQNNADWPSLAPAVTAGGSKFGGKMRHSPSMPCLTAAAAEGGRSDDPLLLEPQWSRHLAKKDPPQGMFDTIIRDNAVLLRAEAAGGGGLGENSHVRSPPMSNRRFSDVIPQEGNGWTLQRMEVPHAVAAGTVRA